MNKSIGKTSAYYRLKNLAESGDKNGGEAPVKMATPPVVPAPGFQHKKMNRSGKRDESERIHLLEGRVELLQNTVASLENENASLRRDLDAERIQLRGFTAALLEINQGIRGTPPALVRELESASAEKGARPLTSGSIIFVMVILAFIIVQLVLLIYADGYLFAL